MGDCEELVADVDVKVEPEDWVEVIRDWELELEL